MLIKPTKKWRCPNGLDDILIPYTYYRLVESYRDADGRTKQRTVVEETFKTLKTDLDIRPVLHKSNDGTKAHLHLAILAYWVVSTARYILKQKGINVRWSEILRITSAQQRVTMAGNTADGKNVRIRKSSEPEEKLASIQSALGTPLELGSKDGAFQSSTGASNPTHKSALRAQQELRILRTSQLYALHRSLYHPKNTFRKNKH